MPRSSRIAAFALAALYVVFWLWWGGSGTPLTPAEIDNYMFRFEEVGAGLSHSDPSLRERFRSLAEQDDGNEYYMINLMKYREKALYPPELGYDDDVQAAAARYNEAVIPALLKRGSMPILLARRQGAFLDYPGAEEWDDVAIVRYRSRRDMLEFALELGAKDLGVHKWASIEKTHVFPAAPVVDFVLIRGAVAVLLTGLGLAFHGISRARSRA